MDKIKLGFVPTRRSIFSAPDAIKYRGLTADRLREIGVDIVDIDDINDEGLLFDDSHIEPIVKKFRAEGVDGIMLCPCCCGARWTSAPNPTARACAIASAACSPPARSCVASRFPSPT